METHSQKRAKATSSAPSTQTSPITCRAKRSAVASSQAPPALSTGSHRSQNLPLSPPCSSSSAAATAPPMNFSAEDSVGRCRCSSGKSHQSFADQDRDVSNRVLVGLLNHENNTDIMVLSIPMAR